MDLPPVLRTLLENKHNLAIVESLPFFIYALGEAHTPRCVCVCVREREREGERERERAWEEWTQICGPPK